MVDRGETRRDRLKQALRENLKRRKEQARGRAHGTATSPNRGEPTPDNGRSEAVPTGKPAPNSREN
jgi:hypothetical protein